MRKVANERQGKIPQTAAICYQIPSKCKIIVEGSAKLPDNDGKLLKCSNCYKIGHLLVLIDFFPPLV